MFLCVINESALLAVSGTGQTNALLLVSSDVLHSRLLLSHHCTPLPCAQCAGQLIWLYVKHFGLGNRYET